jgi:hypothetical protein
MILKRSIGYILSTLIMSCAHRSPQQRLADFINDPENKIVQSIKVGDVKVIAKWLPDQYRNNNPVSTSNNPQTENRSSHEDYSYFNVRFEKSTVEKPANDKVLYLNFDMQNDFKLLCAGDSLSPAICQKIENSVSGSYEYMVAFQNDDARLQKSDFTLYYKDKIFGLGDIAFVYSQKDIQKIPGL